MINSDSIYTAVRKFVSDKIETGVAVRHDWIATEFMNAFGRIDGEDAEIYRYCTKLQVQRIANQCIGKYEQAENRSVDEQILLPGFERLQRAYPVERDGHRELVPIHKLTDGELLRRAEEYDEMAKGCRIHAMEIRNFVRSRTADTQAA